MKQIIIQFSLSILIPVYGWSQHKNDYNWIMGTNGLDLAHKYGGTKLSFSSFPPDTSSFYLPTEMAIDITSISDSSGVLQFYTNGCKILNAKHKVIENGDKLNYPSEGYDDACQYNLSYTLYRGIIALPVPTTDKQYFLFHLQQDFTHPIQFPQSVLYSVIDMSANNGDGAVLKKNILLDKGIFYDMLASVKHGNGRDWWIAVPLVGSDDIGMYLLSPAGIEGPIYKNAPVAWQGQPNIFDRCFAVFSPDGKKYARFSGLNDLNVSSFDRCSGEFGNAVTITFPTEMIWTTGLAFSPNSRFLYVVTGRKVYQFDTWENDIKASKVLVGAVDGFMAPFGTSPYQPLLAPDGRIYISCTDGAYVLHTIHNPDAKGLDCHFVNHDFYLPTGNGFCLPNYPNFRLYDWAESPCDTIGINTPNDTLCSFSSEEKILLTPNPASDFTLITAHHCNIKGMMSVYNLIGQLVYELYGIDTGKTYDIDVSLWPTGIYMVVVRGEGKKVWTSKLVVAR